MYTRFTHLVLFLLFLQRSLVAARRLLTTPSTNMENYYCLEGQGQSWASTLTSSDPAACSTLCDENKTCIGFDVTASAAQDACRLYPVNEPRLGVPGLNNRKYCAKRSHLPDASAQEFDGVDAFCALLNKVQGWRASQHPFSLSMSCTASSAGYQLAADVTEKNQVITFRPFQISKAKLTSIILRKPIDDKYERLLVVQQSLAGLSTLDAAQHAKTIKALQQEKAELLRFMETARKPQAKDLANLVLERKFPRLDFSAYYVLPKGVIGSVFGIFGTLLGTDQEYAKIRIATDHILVGTNMSNAAQTPSIVEFKGLFPTA